MDLRDRAQAALKELEDTIIEFVAQTPGVQNTDIVHALGLQSSYKGKHKNYLSWSIIGRLLEDGRLDATTRPDSKQTIYVAVNKA